MVLMYTRTNQGKRRSVFGSKIHSGWFLCIHGQIKGNDAVYSEVSKTTQWMVLMYTRTNQGKRRSVFGSYHVG